MILFQEISHVPTASHTRASLRTHGQDCAEGEPVLLRHTVAEAMQLLHQYLLSDIDQRETDKAYLVVLEEPGRRDTSKLN